MTTQSENNDEGEELYKYFIEQFNELSVSVLCLVPGDEIEDDEDADQISIET